MQSKKDLKTSKQGDLKNNALEDDILEMDPSFLDLEVEGIYTNLKHKDQSTVHHVAPLASASLIHSSL